MEAEVEVADAREAEQEARRLAAVEHAAGPGGVTLLVMLDAVPARLLGERLSPRRLRLRRRGRRRVDGNSALRASSERVSCLAGIDGLVEERGGRPQRDLGLGAVCLVAVSA